MSEGQMKVFQELFVSRLDTLFHIVDVSRKHFSQEDSYSAIVSLKTCCPAKNNHQTHMCACPGEAVPALLSGQPHT
jgi:hypothetical protein